MGARIVDGRALAREIESRVAADVTELSKDGPVRLVAVSIGDAAAASDVYVRSQSNACGRVGIRYRSDLLPSGTTQDALHAHLRALAADPRVSGIIVQLPLPEGLSARAAQDALDPRKDVEGVHHDNLGRVAGGRA